MAQGVAQDMDEAANDGNKLFAAKYLGEGFPFSKSL